MAIPFLVFKSNGRATSMMPMTSKSKMAPKTIVPPVKRSTVFPLQTPEVLPVKVQIVPVVTEIKLKVVELPKEPVQVTVPKPIKSVEPVEVPKQKKSRKRITEEI